MAAAPKVSPAQAKAAIAIIGGGGAAAAQRVIIMPPPPPRLPRLRAPPAFNAPTASSSRLSSQPPPRSATCMGLAHVASIRRPSISSCFDASIISFIAFTWPFTFSSFSADVAPRTSTPVSSSVASNESRSLGIWYLMNSCMRSCVSLISFVRLSSARLSTRSSCGLMWITRMPKRVLSSCMERKALAKFCCSGDNDSMASLNSLGVGMVVRSRGMLSSSLSLTMAAYLGSKAWAEAMRPTSTNIELNWRARDTSDSFAPDWPEKRCDSHA
mmetsp:Transcript_99881/g.258074  ORF Transcript_99881/g.258074 Transcript_99881/m.258074 type:complete len:271 (+) Transcript_99881:878-1690(+)